MKYRLHLLLTLWRMIPKKSVDTDMPIDCWVSEYLITENCRTLEDEHEGSTLGMQRPVEGLFEYTLQQYFEVNEILPEKPYSSIPWFMEGNTNSVKSCHSGFCREASQSGSEREKWFQIFLYCH